MSAPVGDDNQNGNIQTDTSGRLLPSPMPNSTLSPLPRPTSGLSAVSSLNEKSQERASPDSRAKSYSLSSDPTTLNSRGSVAAENREKQRAVRTLPPWVQTLREDEDALGFPGQQNQIPTTLEKIRPAVHNFMPTPKPNAESGRHYDHLREGAPVTITSPISETGSKWNQFTKASAYPRPSSSRGTQQGQVVDEEWMKENLPDLETPWEPEDEEPHEDEAGFWLLDPSRRRRRMKRIQRAIMNHPLVPLMVRLTVLTFSCLALGLAGSIFHKAGKTNCTRGSSTYIALIVDVVAIVYTSYITYDEYTSKPLGLRSHRAKMRLIFLDLLFIVFDSANLSLAFDSLTDERWACQQPSDPTPGTCELNGDICVRQKALTATLLVALVAWLLTFSISTLRLIEKVAR